MWNRPGPLPGPIGLIAGQGEFPIVLAKAAFASSHPIVVFGVEGVTDKRIEDFTSEAHYIGLGDLGRLIELLKLNKIKQVILAGGVPKKQLYNPQFQLDSEAKTFIHNTSNKGDDHILRALEILLKLKCGARVIDSRIFLKESLAPRGVLSRRKPTEAERRDLDLGLKVAKHIGKMDIGQTVVVKDGIVVSVEALEGTDQAIRRGGELAGPGVVVVKVSKPNQDLRFDLPCVGANTVETLKSVSAAVLGIEAGKTMIISKDTFIGACDTAGLAVVGF